MLEVQTHLIPVVALGEPATTTQHATGTSAPDATGEKIQAACFVPMLEMELDLPVATSDASPLKQQQRRCRRRVRFDSSKNTTHTTISRLDMSLLEQSQTYYTQEDMFRMALQAHEEATRTAEDNHTLPLTECFTVAGRLRLQRVRGEAVQAVLHEQGRQRRQWRQSRRQQMDSLTIAQVYREHTRKCQRAAQERGIALLQDDGKDDDFGQVREAIPDRPQVREAVL